MAGERPPPFDMRAILRDPEGLLSRLELAFALGRPKRILAPVRPPSPEPSAPPPAPAKER